VPVRFRLAWSTRDFDLLDGDEVTRLSADFFRDGGAWMQVAYDTPVAVVAAASAQYLGRGQDGVGVDLEVFDGAQWHRIALDKAGPTWLGWVVCRPTGEPHGAGMTISPETAILRFLRAMTSRTRWPEEEALRVFDAVWRPRGYHVRRCRLTLLPEEEAAPAERPRL
jgi:hypothetical protein